jgi:acyl carrier protein
MEIAQNDSTRDRLLAVINQIVTADYAEGERLEINDKLHIILSESIQALALVATIEDEFDIEFDDEEIDIDFFLDIEHMFKVLDRHVREK